CEILGLGGHEDLRADRGQRLLHRRQIARAIVNQCDQSSPFVDGNIFARRLSFAQATRRARANALNTASILWWLERPYRTLTWTFDRAPSANPSKKSWTSSVCRSPTRAVSVCRLTAAGGRPSRATAAAASVPSICMTEAPA